MHWSKVFFLFSAGTLLSGCGLIFAWALRPCAIEMNTRYIDGSHCNLGNGVYMEELKVHSFTDDGRPDSSETVVRFMCYNPGTVSKNDYWPKRLSFDKPNGHYLWGYDSTKYYIDHSGIYRTTYKFIPNLSAIEEVNMMLHAGDVNGLAVCPIEFKPDTWYYVDTFDPSLIGSYVYFDSRKRTKIFNIESGVSPI